MSDGLLARHLEQGTLRVEPLDPSQVQPASIDVRLDDRICVFRVAPDQVIDPYDLPENMHQLVTISHEDPFVLAPGDFVLGATAEYVALANNIACRVEGKSSLARLGLFIHSAGWIDPGFEGNVTLELSNCSRNPLKLYPGMSIGQLTFELLDAPARRPYGHPGRNSKYHGQTGPVGSRYDHNPRPTT